MKHKCKHRVFLFIVKIKLKIFKLFHQSKISTVLIKIIFYLKLRGNTRREFIGTCKHSVLHVKILSGESPREHVKSRRGAAREDLGIVWTHVARTKLQVNI